MEETKQLTPAKLIALGIYYIVGTVGVGIGFYGLYRALYVGDEDGFRVFGVGFAICFASQVALYTFGRIVNRKRNE